MTEHLGVTAMRKAGFAVLPLINSSGIDDALLFWRWGPDRTVLDVVVAWSDDYAVWTRLPGDRDWSDPFRPAVRERGRPKSFADVVSAVQPRPKPRPADGNAEWFGRDDG